MLTGKRGWAGATIRGQRPFVIRRSLDVQEIREKQQEVLPPAKSRIKLTTLSRVVMGLLRKVLRLSQADTLALALDQGLTFLEKSKKSMAQIEPENFELFFDQETLGQIQRLGKKPSEVINLGFISLLQSQSTTGAGLLSACRGGQSFVRGERRVPANDTNSSNPQCNLQRNS